ncbi:hypothetical protein EGI11_04850 [Chryseobacterium sp. H3056]|uniref:Uncharacterized protein n=1 Tax=Kaistella daneshvariae TaxID=2487074 RepID=A0A3N0WYA9_9FLAO|nr:DUF6520 family protein [Kaistella daneshvariae]ROI10080.1 hypothetical protein EGI11_04850 [Kaistella daneshvariae]
MKNVIMPALLVFAGVGAAFATNKSQNTPAALEKGAYFANGVCNMTPIDCSPTGSVACTFSGHNLNRYVNGTQCSIQLYQP